ncbi:MAG: hypothetical protein L3J52_08825 [Proteobacteria bacterium]|nr:hypothetical protein [Pseudomonadota bacterium]
MIILIICDNIKNTHQTDYKIQSESRPSQNKISKISSKNQDKTQGIVSLRGRIK